MPSRWPGRTSAGTAWTPTPTTSWPRTSSPFCRRSGEEGRRFDVVVLDPPAFAKSQRAVEAAIDGYASLNRQALEMVVPGGLLVTASCSARVTPEAFEGAVDEAGFKAGVDLTLVEERYQPPDHPIRLQFPEGRYLKFLVLRVTPW